MTGFSILLVVLVLTPIGLLILHTAIHRLLSANGRRISGHASAMRAIAMGYLAVGVLATVLKVLVWDPAHALEWLAALIYLTGVYGAMSLLYVNAVNIAETSLTMHTLLEIRLGRRPSDEQLFAKYNAEHMVQQRMDRLVSLGQIRVEGDRHFLAASWLLTFARAVAQWRRILGMPAPVLLRDGERQ